MCRRAFELESWLLGQPFALKVKLIEATNECKYTKSCNLLCVTLNKSTWTKNVPLSPSCASSQPCPPMQRSSFEFTHRGTLFWPQLLPLIYVQQRNRFSWVTTVAYLIGHGSSRASSQSRLDTNLASSIKHAKKSICCGTMEVDKTVVSGKNQTLTTSVDFHHRTTNNNKP